MLGLIAINTNTVHADAINWDNANADSENVGADKSVRPLTNDVKASDKQSVKTSDVQSTQLDNQIKISNVQAGQINKTKIAQFNNNSKIYGLNNSNTLSKNNGDGYVITNAGTYNGHQVDIGVTINNVQNNQGSYTTKWSNGDKASQTGNVDNSFNYQNGVTVNSNALQPVAPNQTRTRTENQDKTYTVKTIYVGKETFTYSPSVWLNVLDPAYLAEDLATMHIKADDNNAIYQRAGILLDAGNITDDLLGFKKAAENGGYYSYSGGNLDTAYTSTFTIEPMTYDDLIKQYGRGMSLIITNYGDVHAKLTNGLSTSTNYTEGGTDGPTAKMTSDQVTKLSDSLQHGGSYTIKVPTNVTDHLQIDQVKNGNLDYNYTIGLYDHDTGNLITSLKPEYKDGVKVGKTATSSDTVMNNAIKNKIADIRNNKAAVAFNGTAANDNVAFYQETTPVQDVSKLTATASRTITLHFPNNQKPASYNNVVNNNNQIVQTLKFTRTGTTDLVTGQTTYTNWQGDSKFPDVKLPKIPGFKLQIS